MDRNLKQWEQHQSVQAIGANMYLDTSTGQSDSISFMAKDPRGSINFLVESELGLARPTTNGDDDVNIIDSSHAQPSTIGTAVNFPSSEISKKSMYSSYRRVKLTAD